MMAAKCDTDSSVSFWDIVRPIISDEFLVALGREFEFDVEETRANWWITKASALYVKGRRAEAAPKRREAKRELEELIEDGRKFASRLSQLDQVSMSLRVPYDSAESDLAIPFDRPELDGLERFKFTTGYVNESERLVRFIVGLAERQLSDIEMDKGGRPKNLGFADFMDYVAEFWETEVGRRFSVDYHDGEGMTPAFEFAKRVVRELDDVSDKQVITAMRLQIRKRADHINRPTNR